MIATGTDIKPLEVVFFMRGVKSRNYFEQMKGRGVRVIKNDDFKTVTPDAMGKDRFVIVDAVGVTESEELNETRPLEQKPGVTFERLLKALRYGNPNKDNLSSMASRLSRLNKKLTEKQVQEIKSISGEDLPSFASSFVEAIDEDKIFLEAQEKFGSSESYVEYEPKTKELEEISQNRMINALKPFIGNGKLMERLPEIKKEVEQIIDDISVDDVEEVGYSPIATEKAKKTVKSFKEFIKENKSELIALQALYNHKKLKWNDLKELVEVIEKPPFSLTTSKLWQAYHQLEDGKIHGRSKKDRIADFISLLRHEIEKTKEIEPWINTVDKRFAEWLGRQKEQGAEFSQEQLNWLERIKSHIAESIEITPDAFEYTPFEQMGGLGKAVEVFGQQKFNKLLIELNTELGG